MADVAQEFQALQAKVEAFRAQKARAEGEVAQLAAQLAALGIENPDDAPEYLQKLETEAESLDEFIKKRVAYLSKKLEV